MKNPIFLIAIMLLLAACSKENTPKPALTPNTVTDADIMGKWLVATDTVFTVQNGQTTSSVPTGETKYITFGANNTAIAADGSNQPEYLIYYVTNGIIKVVSNNDELDFTILSISANQMLIKESASGIGTYDDALFVKQ